MRGNSRKWSLLLVLLLLVSLAATACGGDDDKDDKGDSEKLSQTYESTATGITVKYPEGWIARDSDDGGIEIANSQAALDAMDADEGEIPVDAAAVGIMVGPLDEMGMTGKPVKEVMELFAQGMGGEGEDTEVGEVKDTKIGGKDAARVSLKDTATKGEGFFVGYLLDDNTIVIVFAAAHEGEIDKYEDTVLKIAESVTYSAPEAPAG